MQNKFNNGNPYHGSHEVTRGKLKGETDTDYFYFYCPVCPGKEILRILEYEEREREKINPYNSECKSKAKYGFSLGFRLYCENCGLEDFVKLSNMGWQKGQEARGWTLDELMEEFADELEVIREKEERS